MRVPWLFEGTGLVNGSAFGNYGIEIDARTRFSPPGTVLVAMIPNIFGPGLNAEMTYYETPAGARVFNAGALDFAGSVLTSPVTRMIENLWAQMTARPRSAAHASGSGSSRSRMIGDGSSQRKPAIGADRGDPERRPQPDPAAETAGERSSRAA